MKSPIYLMNSAYAFRMVKEITDFGTDMIIYSTYLVANP